ncbi:hypothetical protein N1851_028013 [Merluccius polli]|uniref:Uncharacterized protein n=1 Tax=Merluccius polli TaxID=89951 RepID=A0AA47M9Q3_MERPO|nr:hypothetical protein N1851_028013 [Merluccius polli]
MMPISSDRFDRKLLFSVRQDLAAERSRCRISLAGSEAQSPVVDVWSIQAPDFSPKLYRSLSGPRSDRGFNRRPQAVSSGDTEKTPGQDVSKVLHVKRVVADILREAGSRRELRRFTTSYKPPDALQAELMFVKLGKFPPSGPYRNPKPHDFRLQDDLPNMATVSKKDLCDLQFRLNHRDILKTTRSESDLTSRDTMKTMMKMDTYKPAEPTWDLRLLLPKPQWPPKSASFTRHRRSRAAYSAFMERVEEKLSTSWSQRA